MKTRDMTEKNILRWLDANKGEIVATGIVEMRAAQRLADEGLVTLEYHQVPQRDGSGSVTVKAVA